MNNEIDIAILLTIIVILFQLIFFIRSRIECKNLVNLFIEPNYDSGTYNLVVIKVKNPFSNRNSDNSVDTDNILSELDYINQLHLKNKNEANPLFLSIIDSTNKYLFNNVDSTPEFNILRDIAERISQSEENKILSSIALPLYIGLMGTLLGVIFGISNIVIKSFNSELSVITDESIIAFLSGIFIAMIASFLGLFLTTVNNSFTFKRAKSIRDERKNYYLNFLISELLTTLNNPLIKSIKEFNNNLIRFNKEFSENIISFNKTIPAITDNIKAQSELIYRIKEIDIAKIAKANLKIFDRIDKSAEIFRDLNIYADNLSRQYSAAEQIMDKVNSVLNRLSNFENNINNIGVLIQNSDKNYAQIGEYIVEKLTALKNRYQLIKEFIDKSEDEIKAIASKSEDNIKALSQKLQQEIDKSFNLQNENNPFRKLEILESVNRNLISIGEKLDKNNSHPNIIKNSDSINNELIEVLKELNSTIIKLKKSIRPSIFKPFQFINFILSKN